jgi:Lon protease-like protein
MSDPDSPGASTGTVRLFPLPNLVLFPHSLQPLHIFEPRYRELMTDALASDREIAMALLRPGWEPHYEQSPAIHPVVCVGRIMQEERLPDGRWNLLLFGSRRGRVQEEIPSDRLYRLARVEWLADVPVKEPTRAAELHGRLSAALSSWVANQTASARQVRRLLESDLPLGVVCDVLSFAMPLEPAWKQELLEELRVEERVMRLLHFLGAIAPAGKDQPAGQRYPPDFSSN